MNTADLRRALRTLNVKTPAALSRVLGCSRQYAVDLWHGNREVSPQTQQTITLLLQDGASDG